MPKLGKHFILIALLALTPLAWLLQLQHPQAQSSGSLPVYRFWSERLQSHFYTISETEKEYVLNQYAATWQYEGIAYDAMPYTGSCDIGFAPLYRFWSERLQAHFFTIDAAEKNNVEINLADTWALEGIAFCAPLAQDSGITPVYRFWSDTLQAHFYTISVAEKNYIRANYPVWQYEGTVFYAFGHPGIATPEPVGLSCPSFNESCVPCIAGEQYCRIEPGKTIGFKGWACQNNNPGNIRYSEFRNSLIAGQGGAPACGERGSFMVFRDPATGRASLQAYLKAIADGQHPAYAEGGGHTLLEFFNIYAPPSDGNDPTAYASDVASRLGVGIDTTLGWAVANRLVDFAKAIEIHEGWIVNP